MPFNRHQRRHMQLRIAYNLIRGARLSTLTGLPRCFLRVGCARCGGGMSEKKRPFKKGDQVPWRGKIAKIASDVIEIEGIACDLRIECDDGEVLTVSQSEL